MKLTAMMLLTVDGVYQGPGGPDEDRRGGFERGGWLARWADPEGWRFITSVYERSDALLLGRKTWEIWDAYRRGLRSPKPFSRRRGVSRRERATTLATTGSPSLLMLGPHIALDRASEFIHTLLVSSGLASAQAD